MVALAIFAVMSGFAYRGLMAMLEGRERLQQETRKWRDTALFVGRLERDLRSVLDRPAKGPSGTSLAPVSSSVEIAATPQNGLAITRSGSALQENALAAPQRVAYRLNGNEVQRIAWTSADAAPRDDPTPVTVLTRVRALEFRFLSRNEWRPTWGMPGSPERIPAAVEVALTLQSGERIVRLLDLLRTP